MKYKEVKDYYESGELERHYFVDENGNKRGEYRSYCKNGKLRWHHFRCNDYGYGEAKWLNNDGTLYDHCLKDGKGNELATAIYKGQPSTHTEEQLIEIAKEHSLPLLTDIPKTETELTHWNLKHPDLPCLSNAST